MAPLRPGSSSGVALVPTINFLAVIIKRLLSLRAISRRVAIELPPPDTKRWTAQRKAAVGEAVRTGMISLEEACRRYGLSVEECLSWQRTIEQHGIPGLRATRVGIYRHKGARQKIRRP